MTIFLIICIPVVFVVGFVIGGWSKRQKVAELGMMIIGHVCALGCMRDALERLVDAVDSGNWRPYRDTETGRRTLEALARARDVLDGKGAE